MNKIILTLILICLTFTNIYANIYKGVKKMKFDNGLVAVIKKDTSVPIVSVNIGVRVGSINEAPSQAGLSHFIEHLLFKGSQNYKGDLMTRTVEKMGGYINAATSREYTCFYIDIQKDGYVEAIKMLADTVANPLFPEDEITQERKVVIEEIQRHKDNPQSELFEYFMSALYKNSDYKNSVIGFRDVIANVSRDEIVKYHSTNYIPSKMVISVVGDIDEKETIDTIKNTLGKLENKELPKEPSIIENFVKNEEFIKEDKVAHSYMLAGFLGPDTTSKDIYVADVAMKILGEGKSSRFHRKLKEEQNIVYVINSSFYTLKGTGCAYILAIFEQNNYKKVIESLQNELDLFSKEGPTKEELKKAKTNIKSEWLFELQTFNEQASLLQHWQLQGHPEILKNYLKNIDKVTVEDIKNFMNKYYSKEKLSRAVIFPK